MSVEGYGRPHLVTAQHAAPGASEIVGLRYEVAGLRRALLTRAPIEQAKGMLMMHFGIPEDAAFALLARWSCDHNVKVRRVALTLVARLTGDDTSVDQNEDPLVLLDRMLDGTGIFEARRLSPLSPDRLRRESATGSSGA